MERTIILRPRVRVGKVSPHSYNENLKLSETTNLARAIDLDVVTSLAFDVVNPSPATLMGKGRVKQLAEYIRSNDVKLVIVDGPLSPIHQRNLEKAWNIKIIDRTGLILEIFSRRAHTREGSLQVKLANLLYQKTRLVRSWTHLERQRGGFGFLAGPGERQIEVDQRLLERDIEHIRSDLRQVVKRREVQSRVRARNSQTIVALAGYTNSGKSSIFNALTGANTLVADKLFATLDTKMRSVQIHSHRKVILSDTVGFISDLPTELVAAFRATLEEVRRASLILHVRDIANPETESQREDVLRVLRSLGIEEGTIPIIECLNKIDLLSCEQVQFLCAKEKRRSRAVPVSAMTGEGIDKILYEIELIISTKEFFVNVWVDSDNGAAQAWLHAHSRVIKKVTKHNSIMFNVLIAEKSLGQFIKIFPYCHTDVSENISRRLA